MLRELYRSAEAVLMPGEEDFGIVPARGAGLRHARGRPRAAAARSETVRDGETGVLMPEPGPAALLAALDRLRSLRLDPAAAAANAVPLLARGLPGRVPERRSTRPREPRRSARTLKCAVRCPL